MYKSNITNAIADYNRNNPTLRKLTLTSIANQIGCSQPYLSGIGKSKEFDWICEFVIGKSESQTAFNWSQYIVVNSKLVQRLEAIRKILGCEIYDLIKMG